MFPEKKFGVIVNDFGEMGVDATLLKNNTSSIVKELNNGQIFCSCLSGSFIDSVSAYADLDIDYLLVETSGLAKPSPLMDILDGVKRISGEKFSYHGMVALLDASSYLQLSEVLNSVDEQIQYSQLVIINKIDTADELQLKKIEMKVLSLNPDADLLRTEFGKITKESFLGLKQVDRPRAPDEKYVGWGDGGRPVPILLGSTNPVSFRDLEDFINDMDDLYFRLKGWVNTDRGRVFADCTVSEKKLNIENGENNTAVEGLVVIVPAGGNIAKTVKKRAEEIFDKVS